jgi:hypothetical protein
MLEAAALSACLRYTTATNTGAGIHPPVSVLSEWTKISDPSNPSQTRGWGLAVLCIVLFALTLATVVARLWARFMVRHTAGIDDAVIVAAMFPTAGLAVATALGSKLYGFDRHAWDLSPEMAVDSRKVTLAIEACYIGSTGLTKISILLFYRRMSAGTVSKGFRFIVHASIASVIAYMIAFLLAGSLGCRPLEAFWLQANMQWAMTHIPGETYTCIDEGALLLAASGISIVQDFLVCGLPMMLFWKLQLPKKQKIALAAIFGVGFFLCITGILRMYYIHHIFYETYDVTWAAWEAWMWTVTEAHVAIICASAPALKTFAKRYMSNFSSGMSRWRTGTQGAYKRSEGYTASEYQRNTSHSAIHTANGERQRSRALELGGISVTREVEVDYRSMTGGTRKESGSLSDEERMCVEPEQKAKESWLRIDSERLRGDI